MELFILGLAIGGVAGAGGRRILKGAAKAYMAVADKTQEVVEDIRRRSSEALEEARAEREEVEPEMETVGDGSARGAEARDSELNRTQAAALLGVPVSTLRYWERRGRLTPAHREGAVCYNANDIAEARVLIRGSSS